MGHKHDHIQALATPDDNTARVKTIQRTTLVGSLGNLLLTAFKFVAGFLGHSAAMIADAVHSLSDFATDIVVIIFVRLANKPIDKDHDYGHGKYETMATAIIGIALLGVGLGICVSGIKDILKIFEGEELEAPRLIALIGAVASILIKEILYQYTAYVGRKVDSPVVIANAWHHRSDAFSSIATTIGIGGAMLLGPKWRLLDPLAAVLVSFFIMKVAYQLVKPSLDELLEGSLPESIEKKIMEAAEGLPQVVHPHNLRTRRVGKTNVVDMHIRLPKDMTVATAHDITLQLEKQLRTFLGNDAILNIHVEPYKDKEG